MYIHTFRMEKVVGCHVWSHDILHIFSYPTYP